MWFAGECHAHDVGQAHPRGTTEHHVLRFEPAHANRDHTKRVHMRGVTVRAHKRVRKGDPVQRMHHRRHSLQIDLVHDAVAGRNHIHIFERALGPVDEVKTIFIATIFNRAIFRKCIGIKATAFDGERVINDQLHRDDGIDLGGIAALISNRIAQARQINERGLPEDVMTHDARREPWEIKVAPSLDQLLQIIRQLRGIGFAQQVFSMHTCGVRELVVSAARDRVDCGAGVEIIKRRAWKFFAMKGVHDFIGVWNAKAAAEYPRRTRTKLSPRPQ